MSEKAEWLKLRNDLAWIRFRFAYEQFFMLETKYNADQPRVPAGSSDGGRWTVSDGFSSPESTAEALNRFNSSDQTDLFDISQPIPPAPIDLRSGEGGHVVQRHVGKTDAQLKAAVEARDERRGYFAGYNLVPKGSFDSVESANRYVNDVLNSNAAVVESVISGKAEGDQVFLKKRYRSPTGKESYSQPFFYSVIRSVRPTFSVGVLIRKAPTPRGYKVVTAYPMNNDPSGD